MAAETLPSSPTSISVAESIADSLRTQIHAGLGLDIRVVESADEEVASLMPRHTTPQYYSERVTCRKLLILVSQGKSLLAGIEAHEFLTIKAEVTRTGIQSSASLNACIEKLDSASHIPGLPRALSIGYVASLRRYNVFSGCISNATLHLFARAQPEYLFAKSKLNPKKNVLDDLSLVKWWMRTLHQAAVYMESQPKRSASNLAAPDNGKGTCQCCHHAVVAHCIVPGLDECEATWFHGIISNFNIDKQEINTASAIGDTSTKQSPAESYKGVVWNWGLPYPLSARAHDCVPQFPDDPAARLLQDNHSSKWSVQMLLDMLSVSEECGAGRRAAFFTLALPLLPSTREDGLEVFLPEGTLSSSDYDEVLIKLFDKGMDFSSEEASRASSMEFIEFLDSEYSTKPLHVCTAGTKEPKSAEKASTEPKIKVNDITMVIRKKRKNPSS